MIVSLVITSIIMHFDVSKSLIDGGSSCDMMYFEMFEKIVLDRGKL